MEIFKGIKKFYPAVYVALVIIWWTDCKNILPMLWKWLNKWLFIKFFYVELLL